jgi:hypothetical protein
MIPWIKGLLYDPQSFANFVRAGIFALGELPQVMDFGAFGADAYWIGKALQILALAIRHGDQTPVPSRIGT